MKRREFFELAAAGGASAVLPDISGERRKKPATFVLVHGAWYGGWCWRRVADRLTAHGHYVVAPTLSGVGERSHLASDSITLATQIDDVINEIKWKDLDDIVLVGHSFGGIVITGAAETIRERIGAIVYVDAFIPLDGQSMADLRANRGTPLPASAVPAPPASYFKVNAKDAAWVNSKVTPHPTKCLTEPVRVTGAYQQVPRKTYIRAPVFPQPAFDDAYVRCRADPAWKTFEMTGGHALMIDQPEQLTRILESVA